MAWRPPQLPPVQRMPKRRGPNKPSYFARGAGAVAGVALLVTGGIGAWRAFNDVGGGGSPFMSLAVLLPAVILIRYAVTGKIKV